MEVTQFSSRITASENIWAIFDRQIDVLDRNFVTLHEIGAGDIEIPTPIAADIKYSDNTVTVDPSIDLKTGVEYSLKFSKGAVRTSSGETFPSGSTSSHALIFQITPVNNFSQPIPFPTPTPIPFPTPSPIPIPLPVPTPTPIPQPLPVPTPTPQPVPNSSRRFD